MAKDLAYTMVTLEFQSAGSPIIEAKLNYCDKPCNNKITTVLLSSPTIENALTSFDTLRQKLPKICFTLLQTRWGHLL